MFLAARITCIQSEKQQGRETGKDVYGGLDSGAKMGAFTPWHGGGALQGGLSGVSVPRQLPSLQNRILVESRVLARSRVLVGSGLC